MFDRHFENDELAKDLAANLQQLMFYAQVIEKSSIIVIDCVENETIDQLSPEFIEVVTDAKHCILWNATKVAELIAKAQANG